MLRDKVAIVTGSSRGIGNAVARIYLDNGAKVAICGSKVENAERAINDLVSMGYKKDNMLALGIDMTSTESVNSAVSKVVDIWGKIDILVNNAGITSTESILTVDDSLFENMYNVNVLGVVRMIRAVANYMKETGGTIINTSSMVGINGGNHQAAYASSKSAVNGLTISLAKELGPMNIRVNAVAPGVVETDMMKDSTNDEMRAYLNRLTPLKRFGKPEDLAGAYLYLASDNSTFTTGTIIKVDGGLMM